MSSDSKGKQPRRTSFTRTSSTIAKGRLNEARFCSHLQVINSRRPKPEPKRLPFPTPPRPLPAVANAGKLMKLMNEDEDDDNDDD
jgi:hypothetical protein